MRTSRLQKFGFLVSAFAVNVLFVLGLVFTNASHSNSTQKAYAFDDSFLVQKQQQAIKTGIPVRLHVPSKNINIAIKKGDYDAKTDSWTLSDAMAFYATPTPPLSNRRGGTLIYAHNKTSAFAKLHDLIPGDTLKVYTDNGLVFTYIYKQSQEVEPNNTSVLTEVDTAQPTITLQTCSGDWSQYRRLFSFSLLSVENSS